jgi:predicted house-cleaning noncanonical NTP pyrophosphatase (MazG superfamily)
MELALTSPEKVVLRETLEKAIKDMLMEIANTDNRKMRLGLKEREEILITILAKLPVEVHIAA